MASLAPIKKDSDLRQDWRTVNVLIQEVSKMQSATRRLNAEVEKLRTKLIPIDAGSGGSTARWA
jgi:hypothetical protein